MPGRNPYTEKEILEFIMGGTIAAADSGKACNYLTPVLAVNATEGNTQICIPMPENRKFIVEKIKATVNTAPGDGKTVTVTLRKNGADTGLIATITGTTATEGVDADIGSPGVEAVYGPTDLLSVLESQTAGGSSTILKVQVMGYLK